jgi:hypothetical protein
MISFGQIIDPDTNPSHAWEATRLFTYGSIITNLTATMLALLAILFCSDVEGNARHKLLEDIHSLPHQVSIHNKRIPRESQIDKHGLIKEFGMSRFYKWAEFGQLLWVIFGMCSTFLAFTTWIWLSQSHLVFGLLMVPIVFGFFGSSICLIVPVIPSYY